MIIMLNKILTSFMFNWLLLIYLGDLNVVNDDTDTTKTTTKNNAIIEFILVKSIYIYLNKPLDVGIYGNKSSNAFY